MVSVSFGFPPAAAISRSSRKIRHRAVALIGPASRADCIVQLGALLRFILGLVQVADGAEAVAQPSQVSASSATPTDR